MHPHIVSTAGGSPAASGKVMHASIGPLDTSGIAAAGSDQDDSPAAGARAREDHAEVLSDASRRPDADMPPPASGGIGWVTAKGTVMDMPAATTSRIADLFRDLDEVSELAVAAEPNVGGAALVLPATGQDRAAKPPSAPDAAAQWSTGSGRTVTTSAIGLATAAAVLFCGTGTSAHGAAAAEGAQGAGLAVAPPFAAPASQHSCLEEPAAGDKQLCDSPWTTARGGGVQVTAAAAAQAAAIMGNSGSAMTLTTDSGIDEACAASPCSTGKGGDAQMPAEAGAQVAKPLGSSSAMAPVAGRSVAGSVAIAQPLAAADPTTRHGHKRVGSAKAKRKCRSQQMEGSSSAACAPAASAEEGQAPAARPPLLALLPSPQRRSEIAAPSLHRSAVERSARGASAAPSSKGRSVFRPPLQTLSPSQQVCVAEVAKL